MAVLPIALDEASANPFFRAVARQMPQAALLPPLATALCRIFAVGISRRPAAPLSATNRPERSCSHSNRGHCQNFATVGIAATSLRLLVAVRSLSSAAAIPVSARMIRMRPRRRRFTLLRCQGTGSKLYNLAEFVLPDQFQRFPSRVDGGVSSSKPVGAPQQTASHTWMLVKPVHVFVDSESRLLQRRQHRLEVHCIQYILFHGKGSVLQEVEPLKQLKSLPACGLEFLSRFDLFSY